MLPAELLQLRVLLFLPLHLSAAVVVTDRGEREREGGRPWRSRGRTRAGARAYMCHAGKRRREGETEGGREASFGAKQGQRWRRRERSRDSTASLMSFQA